MTELSHATYHLPEIGEDLAPDGMPHSAWLAQHSVVHLKHSIFYVQRVAHRYNRGCTLCACCAPQGKAWGEPHACHQQRMQGLLNISAPHVGLQGLWSHFKGLSLGFMVTL